MFDIEEKSNDGSAGINNINLVYKIGSQMRLIDVYCLL